MKWIHKIIIACIISLLFVPFITISVHASDATQRIYDDADILSESDITKLEKLAAKHSKKHKTDIIILTTDKGLNIPELERYMQDTYDEKGFGYDKEHGNAAIMTIDLESRNVNISGFYKAERRLSFERAELVQDKIAPYLSNDDYVKAFNTYIKTSSKYMNYIGGVNPANPLYKSSVQFVIALIIGGIVVGMMLYRSSAKITTTARTYQDIENTRLLQQEDRYIRTTVTKTAKPKNNSGGGGGRGGGGGVTGGGHSHSSSSRSF